MLPPFRTDAWTRSSEFHLRDLVHSGVSTRLIALLLGRSVPAVRRRASKLGLHLSSREVAAI